MTLEKIKKFDGEIVNQEEFDALMEDENVIDCKNNGGSGLYHNKTWFSIILKNGDEIQIYG